MTPRPATRSVGLRVGVSARTARKVGYRGSLVFLVLAAILLTGAQVALTVQSYPDDGWTASFQTVVALVYVVIGVIAWDRRPGNRTGLLLCGVGGTLFCAAFANMNQPVLYLFGYLLAQSCLAAIFCLLLAYPSGRLGSTWAKVVIAAACLTFIGFQIPQYLFGSEPQILAGLRIEENQDVVGLCRELQGWIGLGLALGLAAVLGRRLMTARAVGNERMIRAWVYAYGTFVLLVLPLSIRVLAPYWMWPPLTVFVIQLSAILGIPFVFGAGLLFGGFARTGEIDDLGSWLGSSDPGRVPLRQALARALGDDSLRLVFRDRHTNALLDSDGVPVDRSVLDTAAVGVVEVRVRGAESAMILYDADLVADRDLVESAGRVVALALEGERLTAELLASRKAVVESRTRLVEVGDQERRRFAHDLHDTLQSRLVVAAIHAGSLANRYQQDSMVTQLATDLRIELESTITELRRMVHGVVPALLLERGLFAAAEDLTDRAAIEAIDTELEAVQTTVPISEVIATTAYFILAEALANAMKHSGASRVLVRLAVTNGGSPPQLEMHIKDNGCGGADPSSSGLRGMADRADAVSGSFLLTSPVGAGTSIAVSLPCG